MVELLLGGSGPPRCPPKAGDLSNFWKIRMTLYNVWTKQCFCWKEGRPQIGKIEFERFLNAYFQGVEAGES